MLDDAVAAFLDTVGEREFDEPLMALLRAEGYTDVRLVHGQTEFGKDVIAKKDGEQWVFQSKAGNLNLAQFRPVRDQLYDLRTSALSAPGFDKDLPRRAVLVQTGRLTGQAPLAAQEYEQQCVDREETPIEFWNKDLLLGKLSANPDAILRGSMDGQLLGLIGAIDAEQVDMEVVERFSRRWTSWEPMRFSGLGIIEASLVCERLRGADRLDLACQVALCAVRGAWAAGAAEPDSEATRVGAEAAGRLFEIHARQVWAECDDRLLEEFVLESGSGFASWVTYQIRCMRTAEFLALLALRVRADAPDVTAEITAWLAKFAEVHPGITRPIGDRYAVSVIPVAALLLAEHREVVETVLRRTAIWVCDRYERDELGLESVDGPVFDEVCRVVAGPFDFGLTARQESQIASVLLDVSATLDLRDVYADVRNDTLAVDLYPSVLLLGPGPDQLSRDGGGNSWDYNPDYADVIDGTAPA
ncbi:MAG TPA: restriction endonuclease, partial [Polyangia bacterium]